MRKLSADYIFPIVTVPIKNGVVTIADDGTIIDLSVKGRNDPDTEIFDGIICPGFINTHCHLELSHLRSVIPSGRGMADFIKNILSKRNFCTPDQIQNEIEIAEREMINNGIVAVADISNTNDTLVQKSKGNIYYHTFIEIFNPNPAKAAEFFQTGLILEKEFKQIDQKKSTVSIAPHAPYTMSKELLLLINSHARNNKNCISIHNQESEGENQLFLSNSGNLFTMFKELGFDTSFFPKTNLNALQSTLPHLLGAKKVLLVHNTFTTEEDILWAKSLIKGSSKHTEIFWCTCPNANLYIENKLPDYQHFISTHSKVTIGTDSLASNWGLSVLDELKTISNYYPEISIQTLLTWATKNGAEFLALDQLGTIEKGKKPGLNLLRNVHNLLINKDTKVVKLI